MSYFKCVCTTLHMAVPGTMLVIKTAKSAPKTLLRYRTPWLSVQNEMRQQNEEIADDSDVMEIYHGCSVKALPFIVANGFKPTIGTGCDALEEHFGLPTAGTFFTGSWKCASNYPMTATTGKSSKHNSISGGTLIDDLGTYPMRAVIRCLAKKSDYLWHKKQTNGEYQYIYRPQDVYMTHISLYAVGASLCHKVQTLQTVY